jgi:hypothetical protein
MWFLLPLAAVAGAGLYELLRPATKQAVVQFTSNTAIYDSSEAALKKAGIDYEAFTDGYSSWLMVKPSDRERAVPLIISAAQLLSPSQRANR